GGRVAFGADDGIGGIGTVCGNRGVLDGQWHHVAVTRSGGEIRLFVDGVADGSINGIAGDLSYPDNGQPQPGNCGSPSGCPNDPFLVVGAEKHDAFPASRLAFNGLIDELRLSDTARYTGNFVVPTTPFSSSTPNTAALYHFDESTTDNCTSGTVIGDSATGGASPGACFFGGSPGGPVWSADSPFAPTGGGAGTLQFSAANASATEGVATVALTVTRTGGSTGTVSVSYASADGSATANNDYTPVNAQLNWANGETASKAITIPILDDSLTDPGESFTVTLSNPTNGATLGTPAAATIAITDNDSPGTLQLSAATYAVTEGTATRAITVTRTSGNAGAVMVNYATSDGTAVAPGDYTSAVGTLSWNSGDSSPQTFSVPITDDQATESGESFAVAISGPSGGATLGTPTNATVTISDNDSSGGGGTTNRGGGGGGAMDLGLMIVGLLGCLLERRRRQDASC
ncbi:MAG TPA: Calx-beta domain-containing protein, partial [Steroidobacteraceae bacterium]|nr:Calx-beta domain-containing protein [Steroidobacteraceae bacterium]